MILLTHGQVQANGKAVVYGIHYMPETLTDEEKVGGLLVDSELPRPAEEKGYSWAHYVDPVTLVQSYEKVARPLSPEESLEDLKAANQSLVANNTDLKSRVSDLELAMADLFKV